MSVNRRIFISVSPHRKLDERRQRIRRAVLDRISKEGYQLEITLESGEALGVSWSPENIERIMRRCIGAVSLAFPRWSIPGTEARVSLSSEFIHYESAVAHVLKIPLLVIAEEGLAERGVVSTGAGRPILFVPQEADETWIDSAAFRDRFAVWLAEVARRRDVFLGYAKSSRELAGNIKRFLTQLDVSTLDWHDDFAPGRIRLQKRRHDAAEVYSYSRATTNWMLQERTRFLVTMLCSKLGSL